MKASTKQIVLRGRPGWVLSGAAVDLYFANGLYYPSRDVTTQLTCSRASSGYAQTVAGTLTSFAANALRITDQGLLVEESRTNLIQQSQAFGNTYWTAASAGFTEADDVATAPDGTVTADSLARNTTVANAYEQTSSITVTASSTYTFSIYAKAKSVDGYYGLRLQGAYPIRADATFNINSGAGAVVATSSTTFTSPSATITALANGWYRLTLTLTVDAGTTSVTLVHGPTSSGQASGSSGAFWEGPTGSLSDAYVWGAQLEQATFATSYIPTTTVAVTRAFDLITASGALLSTLDASVASIFEKTLYYVNQNNNSAAIAGGTNRQLIASVGTSSTALGEYNGSTQIAAIAGSRNIITGVGNTALGWDGTGRSMALNNGSIATDGASVGALTGIIYVGSYGASASAMDGYIERLVGWNTRLSDAQLQTLTV